MGPNIWNADDKYSRLEGNISLSGPIIEDTLFFYVLYNPRDISNEYITGGGSAYNDQQSDDAFWGGKIDWNITDNHLLEVTAFSDERTTEYVRENKSDLTDSSPNDQNCPAIYDGRSG